MASGDAATSPYLRLPDGKPLKILTIDGGGLQAISTLLLLDELLNAIAVANHVPKPRPCDIFDGIFGIGVGGWLAILLGRFHLDITSCLSEWYTLMKIIQPRFKAAGYFFKVTQQHYYDTEQLVKHIAQLTKNYGTGKLLFDTCKNPPRCRHVFVAALEDNGEHREYLFRTYECPDALKANLLPGPKEPSNFEISSAFGVTGAAKYFAPPWKESMDNGKKLRFRDTKFPRPHNITELALEEMWGLYGPQVPISVVVNIGPGLPGESDIKTIARKFSWGLPSKGRAGSRKSSSDNQVAPKVSPGRNFTSLDPADVEAKIQGQEKDIEATIKRKLQEKYPDEELYFRFALEVSPEGAPQNDRLDPEASSIAVKRYIESGGSSTVSLVRNRFSGDNSLGGRSSTSLDRYGAVISAAA